MLLALLGLVMLATEAASGSVKGMVQDYAKKLWS